ncbi:unnamed protein product [Bursaphelenchus xylophilus]|uniref:(pine wood nematode) hypothetical protein n=1 Tax=Bursaphelenchus xylophilus TaxID=6326 RepID=A0A1I7SRG6_BURXY|nr:unnamed protein product [Bursaphelenchus xylophilus]CAG9102428.1 unnamed protein product [Bursaphelenchus xylophilus]
MEVLSWSYLPYVVFWFYAIKVLRHVLWHSYVYFWAPEKDLKKLAKTDWAAVTGATGGIGKGYAFELAKKGFNLILIARNPQKLEVVKQELKEQYPEAQIEVLVFDFSTTSTEEYERILGKPLEKVGLLINNVGRSYEIPDKLHLIAGGLPELKNIITINLYSCFFLCKMVLKHMEKRGGGVVVNVGSSSESLNFAYYSAYCGVKRSFGRFSDCIRIEYPNLTIQHTMPAWVATNMSKTKDLTITVRSPAEYAASAVKTIGYCNQTRGFWSHQLQFDFLQSLPLFITNPLFEFILRMKKYENLEFIKAESEDNNNETKKIA